MIEITIKIIGSFFIAFSGISIGSYLRRNLDLKLAQLNDMLRIISIVTEEIDYLDCDYNEIKEKLLSNSSLKSSNFLNIYKTKSYSSFPVQWREAVFESDFITSEKAKEDFATVGDIIGSYQKEIQLRHLKLTENSIKREKDELMEYIKTHGKVYKSLSALGSALIIIIML